MTQRITQRPDHAPAPATHNEERQILTVGGLARQARVLLEERFHLIWVEGEISNLAQPRSGHWYFTLKDDKAQIRCAMFAGRNRTVRFPVRNGLKVLLRGRISLYEARGDFQIIAEHLEPAGEGALRAAYDALKGKLEDEGLFAAERKRPLPDSIARVAVISSTTGAALRDFLNVVERRFPALQVVVWPVAVQGDRAGPEIVAALQSLSDHQASSACDVAVVTRGGGSLEDLWAFNLEPVARAIAACPIPVVSAVGHQTDFTIADFVADLRAPTPSAAAELITPDAEALAARLGNLATRLVGQLQQELRWQQSNLARLSAGLIDPNTRLQQQMQRADDYERRLSRSTRALIDGRQDRLTNLWQRLLHQGSGSRVQAAASALNALTRRLHTAQQTSSDTRALQLAATARTLQAVSPLNTLARGYAAVLDEHGQVVDDSTAVATGSRLQAFLKQGRLDVTVTGSAAEASLSDILDPAPSSTGTTQ